MIYKIFTCHDSKAEAYLPPFFMATRGAALRAFGDTVSDPNSLFAKHPADYTLFEIGEFNDATCELNTHTNLINLGLALDFLPKQTEALRGVQ